jgi:DNA polymerase III delta prime subunit
MPQPAWLVYGPPGCGKTTWILSQVKAARKKLFHWNARTDRTLREGRECLHQQVRCQEPLFVWIEGADDLTPEAQAFLRRILETVSQPVQCVLECRDPQRITPAIQSRCEWKQCPVKSSFRKKAQMEKIKPLLQSSQPVPDTCLKAFEQAINPIDVLKGYLQHPSLWKEALCSLKEVGGGASPWAHMYKLRALESASFQ